jgi:hypothetical protein
VNELAKNEHIISLLWILPELYVLLLHNPATFIQTHPWQSNHCSTSAQTQQHDHSTFHTFPNPQHATIAQTPPLGQTTTSPGPHLPPGPTNLTLKTFSTLSLPIQTTTFDVMNVVNLDVCTSPPHPIHLSSTVMRSSANSTTKTWYSFLSPLTPGHGLARWYRHSLPPPITPAKNLWCTTHTNSKYHQPSANLMYECVSQPPCQLRILISVDIRWTKSASPTRRTYTAPTPSLHLYNSSDLANLRHTAHYYVMLLVRSHFIPQAPHLTSTLSSLWKIHTPRKYVAS